jgi:hypothetical protein
VIAGAGDDDVRHAVAHHELRRGTQVEAWSDGDGWFGGRVSSGESIELPGRVSKDDVPVGDDGAGSYLIRADDDNGVDASTRATVRRLAPGEQVTTPECMTLPTVGVAPPVDMTRRSSPVDDAETAGPRPFVSREIRESNQ